MWDLQSDATASMLWTSLSNVVLGNRFKIWIINSNILPKRPGLLPRRRLFSTRCLKSRQEGKIPSRRLPGWKAKCQPENQVNTSSSHSSSSFPLPLLPLMCSYLSRNEYNLKIQIDKYLFLSWTLTRSHTIGVVLVAFRVPVLKYPVQIIKININK